MYSFPAWFFPGQSMRSIRKGEWFLTAGGKMPLSFKPLMYNPYVQAGTFLTSRLAIGMEYQYGAMENFYRRNSYGAFMRYYFMNSENVGLYAFSSMMKSHTVTSSPYILKNSTDLGFGIGSSIRLAENWRLNMEVNLLSRTPFGGSSSLGISYTIPDKSRKKTLEKRH